MTDLTVAIADGVALLALNRPERRNAYNAEMGELLNRAYRECDDDAVRAIVLTGAGEAFCAGADFSTGTSAFDAPSSEFTAAPTDPAAFELRTPIIAAVDGHPIGIRLTIALQADIRIIATDAKYAVAQVRRGVIPDCMSHWTLPHLAGGAVAADTLLTGREVLDDAMAAARDIAVSVAPMSVALSKRLLWNTLIKCYRSPNWWTTSVSGQWQPLPEIVERLVGDKLAEPRPTRNASRHGQDSPVRERSKRP